MRVKKRIYSLLLILLLSIISISEPASADTTYSTYTLSGKFSCEEQGFLLVFGYNETYGFSRQLEAWYDRESTRDNYIRFSLPDDGSTWHVVGSRLKYYTEHVDGGDTLSGSSHASYSKTINTPGSFTGTSIKQAVDAANNAYNKAEDARIQATSAKNSADSAKSAANNAKTAADNAYNKANSNNSILSNSSKGLYKTYEKAESARAQASAATTAANNAKASSDNAKTAANNAYSKAESARAQAATATTAANNAKTSADSAKTAANNAKTSADNAYNKAESARAQAATATTAANNAKTSADGAKTAANNAKTSADNAYNKAESARAQAVTATTRATESRDAAKTAAEQTKFNNQSAAYWSYYSYLNGLTDNTAPTITKVEGQNGATCTTGSTFKLVISASDNGNNLRYKVVCNGFNSGWTSSNIITINGLSNGAKTAQIYVSDNTSDPNSGNISQTTHTFFKI